MDNLQACFAHMSSVRDPKREKEAPGSGSGRERGYAARQVGGCSKKMDSLVANSARTSPRLVTARRCSPRSWPSRRAANATDPRAHASCGRRVRRGRSRRRARWLDRGLQPAAPPRLHRRRDDCMAADRFQIWPSDSGGTSAPGERRERGARGAHGVIVLFRGALHHRERVRCSGARRWVVGSRRHGCEPARARERARGVHAQRPAATSGDSGLGSWRVSWSEDADGGSVRPLPIGLVDDAVRDWHADIPRLGDLGTSSVRSASCVATAW